MLSFLKSKSKAGVVGLEVRADGLSFSLAKPNDEGVLHISECVYRECNAAKRSQTLNELVSEFSLSGMPCRLVLPSDQYKVYPIEKPKVEENELADAVRWRVKDLLDFDLDDVVIDSYDFPNDALRGRPEQVNVVVSRSVVIQELVNLVDQSDLELDSIDIVDLAVRNIAQRIANDAERAVAILYLRPGAGMIVLVKGDTVYFSRHFHFSLDALKEPSQQDSVIQQLSLEIQRSFDYFESQLGQVPPRTVSLIGPAPNVPLANMLGGSIAAQVELLDLSSCYGKEHPIALAEIHAFAAMGGVIRDGQA